jgi:hypothetical protein
MRRCGVLLLEIFLAFLMGILGEAADEGDGGGGSGLVEAHRVGVEVEIGLL